MSTVQRIDGTIVEHVQIVNIQHVGEEGSRSGVVILDGVERPVYQSIVDGFTTVWNEQITEEEWKAMRARKE